jgi:hypothetical protein
MIVSDAPNCGVTYDCHYDNHNSFIIQATGPYVIILFTAAIYHLSMVLLSFGVIKQYYYGKYHRVAINYHGKKFYNIGLCRQA